MNVKWTSAVGGSKWSKMSKSSLIHGILTVLIITLKGN
jgi:hypothetical protein